MSVEPGSFFTLLANLSVLIFVITSMLQMGFSLTAKQIIEPLKNAKLVAGALLANFALVPIAAYLILSIIPLEKDLAIGLALLATAAGAPFLPKLAQVAKGDQTFSVGLMILLMGLTIVLRAYRIAVDFGSRRKHQSHEHRYLTHHFHDNTARLWPIHKSTL